ncbi:NAD(P)/FAD-dependent oxidoreductase [Paenibacillus sp. J5C_2022]|uniref:NAD(P)/FAD-dependent oxidoreductase n=1 Tax=Paenibacillus sp. J5C2022 TaxID=2977129 RepID=UPI0021D2353C|nr:NAD(P)/FAD-dependent oxidoreductase [Paenibacillus sp. J5C2022]MCU6712868.1 NAD(P)/FAD-dependent oxidoreductase [Paenibacillus sp. J5C2022]
MKSEHPNSEIFTDITIIGGGPTGMFAAFYAGMRQASVKIIDSMPQLGGQPTALYSEKFIYDIAGFPKVTAAQLVKNLEEQMSRFPVDVRLEEKVHSVVKKGEYHFEIVSNKAIHYSKSVIITGGIGAFEPRKLELDGVARFEAANLHYFVKDLNHYAGQNVVINGGGDSAVDWALMLEPIANQVTLIHRRDKFRAHEHSVKNLMESKVNVVTFAEISMLHGEERIERLTITFKSGEITEIPCGALIVSYGFVSSLGPISNWGLDIHNGSIVVDTRMQTNIPGIYAAGDITTYPGKLKLIAVGFGEAPTAINNAKVYIDPSAKLSPGHSSHIMQ